VVLHGSTVIVGLSDCVLLLDDDWDSDMESEVVCDDVTDPDCVTLALLVAEDDADCDEVPVRESEDDHDSESSSVDEYVHDRVDVIEAVEDLEREISFDAVTDAVVSTD
jgi:hypothetical protein